MTSAAYWRKEYSRKTGEYLGVVWCEGGECWMEDRYTATFPCENAAAVRLWLHMLEGRLTNRTDEAA